MSRNSFLSVFYVKIALLIFLTGKILKFVFFLLFLYFLVRGTNGLSGYNLDQTIFFFLTFNLIDVIAQFLFREVYRFRGLIVTGDFDLVLLKPINPLFRVLMGGADVIDLITIPPLIFAVFHFGSLLNPSLLNVALYILLILNGLFIAMSFYIAALSLGIITLEFDNTIMLFRDLTSLGRFPIEIYREPLRSTLTYLIPVGIMITLPAKVMMGLATPLGIVISFAVGLIFYLLSMSFWNFALKRYTSASS
jgi:ABC-2 type transport system permease protein